MKLIDLLVKELPKRGGWPEGAEIAVQDADSQICFSSHSDVYTYECQTDWYGGDWGDGDWSNPFIDTIADDRHNSIVTRNQYESALAASKAIVGHDGWIEWGGGECPVDSDAIVEVKFRWHNQHQYNNDRAGDFDWAHTGSSSDIIAYRLHRDIKSRASDDRLEQDLNECIGQGVVTEWDGEGLPPVGLICEGRFPRHPGISFEWQECLVLYVFERECAVKSKSTSTLHYCDEFRPLRTEAERKRDASIEAIDWFMPECIPDTPNEYYHAKKIYDAIAAGKIPGVKLEGK